MENQNFQFEYGQIKIMYRLHVDRPIKFQEININKGIRIGLQHKVKNYRGDSFWEIQVVYKDENDKLQLFKGDLEDYQLKILYKGNMQIEL